MRKLAQRRARVRPPSAPTSELEAEQQYFDRAAERRTQLQNIDSAMVEAGASPGGQAALLKQLQAQAADLGSPDDPIAFGRVDFDDGESLYIGSALIQTADHDTLVVSMKAPVADVFYSATVGDPLGLRRKRSFRTTRNHIDDFDDLVFAQLADDIADLVGADAVGDDDLATARIDDGLLDELARHRSGEMAEIAKTIQASQHAIITAPYDRLLVVQGGPGTGKTAVALHRLSWLLYRRRDTVGPSDVLVVGPNPTFVRYIRQVLPDLGDRDVRQTDITRLCAPQGVVGGRPEDRDVAAMKGERRVAALLRQGLRDRVGASDKASYDFAIGTRTVRFTPDELNEQATDIMAVARAYRDGRDRLRDWIAATVATRAGVGQHVVPRDQLEQFTDRVWPQLNERVFLRELFGSRDRLLSAAGELFTAGEVGRLYRQAATRVTEETWTDADLPLLDFVARGINGPTTRYEHVVVDEAQDLSPMELLAIQGRMANGATIVGDIAQSTGPWARDSWDDVMQTLRLADDDELVHLELGYRVPAEVFAVAEQVLRVAAPGVVSPRPVRLGGHEPGFVHTVDGDVASTAVDRAKAHSANGNSVGIICPDVRWEELETELNAHVDKWVDASTGRLGSAINMIRPHQAKGLEFDAVVVVDPEAIVAANPRGARMLYVALTRTTTHLDVVHTGAPLPGLSAWDPPMVDGTVTETIAAEAQDVVTPMLPPPAPTTPRAPDVGAPPAPSGGKLLDAVAQAVADDLRSTVRPDQYEHVLNRVRRLLGEPR